MPTSCVPEKWQIEMMMYEICRMMRKAGTVSEIETWFEKEIDGILCYIANRARLERTYIEDCKKYNEIFGLIKKEDIIANPNKFPGSLKS